MGTPELPPLEKYRPYSNVPADAGTELRKALRAHYDNGASMKELAEQISCATETVRRQLVTSGATIRKRGQYHRHIL
jgi:hypothetical protein